MNASYGRNTLEKKKNLYFAFADLKKACNRVSRGVIRWTIRKLNVDECPIENIMAMYAFSDSAVRVNNTVGNKFNVKVGIHQGSVLSNLLFVMVLEVLSRGFRIGLSWEMLYADDLVIIAESVWAWRKVFGMEKHRRDQRSEKCGKIMKCGTNEGPVFASGKYLWDVWQKCTLHLYSFCSIF